METYEEVTADTLKGIIDAMSPAQLADLIIKLEGTEYATVLQGQLAIKIIEAK